MKTRSRRKSTNVSAVEGGNASQIKAIGVLTSNDLQVIYARREALGELAIKPTVSDAEVKARAAEVGKSSRTLWVWLAAFRKHGLEGLGPKTRSDAGSYRRITSDVVDMVRGIRLSSKDLPVRAVLESAQEMAGKLGMPQPRMKQVRRICEEIDPVVKLLADQRNSEFQDKFQITFPRQHSGVEYQIDHNRVDVLVRDLRQPKYRTPSKEVRPWMTAVMDAASRRVVAVKFSYDPPNRHTVAGAIRSALLAPRGGLPDRVSVDNGKDLVSAHVAQLVKSLEIEFNVCDPHRPQQRGVIERFFRTVNTRLWSTLPGYVDSNTVERNPSATATLTISELETRFLSFLDVYHSEVHESIGMSPDEYWNQHSRALPFTNVRLLDVLLLEPAVRTVIKQGIKFSGRNYWHPALATKVSKSVLIRADTHYQAPDEVEVYFEAEWLCTAFALDSERGHQVSRNDIADAQSAQVNAAKADIVQARSRLKAMEAQIVASQHVAPQSDTSDTQTRVMCTQPHEDGEASQLLSAPPLQGQEQKSGGSLFARLRKKKLSEQHSSEISDMHRQMQSEGGSPAASTLSD